MNTDDFIVESIDDLFPGETIETKSGKARAFTEVPLAETIRHQTLLTLTARNGIYAVSGAFEEGNDPHWITAYLAKLDPVAGDNQYRTRMIAAADSRDYGELAQWSIEYLHFLAHTMPERGSRSPNVAAHVAAVMNNTGYSFLELSKQSNEGAAKTILLHRAQKYLEKAIQTDEETPFAHNNLGDVYHALGDRGLARTHYQLELGHNPDHPTARESLLSLQ